MSGNSPAATAYWRWTYPQVAIFLIVIEYCIVGCPANAGWIRESVDVAEFSRALHKTERSAKALLFIVRKAVPAIEKARRPGFLIAATDDAKELRMFPLAEVAGDMPFEHLPLGTVSGVDIVIPEEHVGELKDAALGIRSMRLFTQSARISHKTERSFLRHARLAQAGEIGGLV